MKACAVKLYLTGHFKPQNPKVGRSFHFHFFLGDPTYTARHYIVVTGPFQFLVPLYCFLDVDLIFTLVKPIE